MKLNPQVDLELPVQVLGRVRPDPRPGAGPAAERQGVRLPRARHRVRRPLELFLQPRRLQANRIRPPRSDTSFMVGFLCTV